MARPSPRRSPPRPVWPRRSARSLNASVSGIWAINCWRSTNGSASCGLWKNTSRPPRKKTAEAIQQEITREVSQLLGVILNGRRQTGHLELEATEMLVRSAMHHAGATVLTRLLQFPVPAADPRSPAPGLRGGRYSQGLPDAVHAHDGGLRLCGSGGKAVPAADEI